MISFHFFKLMKDSEDMQTIGPIIKEQQKIVNDCVEKKLTLSKLQSSIWEKSSKSTESFSITDMDMNDDLIKDLIDKDLTNINKTYKMK